MLSSKCINSIFIDISFGANHRANTGRFSFISADERANCHNSLRAVPAESKLSRKKLKNQHLFYTDFLIVPKFKFVQHFLRDLKRLPNPFQDVTPETLPPQSCE